MNAFRKTIAIALCFLMIFSLFGCSRKKNTVTMGSYQGEPIEWIVFKTEKGKMLLLSEKVLDAKQFDVTGKWKWEESSLRTWLNNDFYDQAFSPEEKEKILLSTVENHLRLHSYDRELERLPNTEDKVFLLSFSELEEHNRNFKEPLTTNTTSYSSTMLDPTHLNWWLRTSYQNQISDGTYIKGAAHVISRNDGNKATNYIETLVVTGQNSFFKGVRPAIWIKE